MLTDTFRYGQLWVDATGTIELLRDRGLLSPAQDEFLDILRETHVELEFDSDWNGFGREYGIYSDEKQLPLVTLGSFGGYPGGSLNDANREAAEKWAQQQGPHIYTHTDWFGGCPMSTLSLDLSAEGLTEDHVREAVALIEGFADYPVLDDELYSLKRMLAWDEMIDEMIADVNRERENTDYDPLTDAQVEHLKREAREHEGSWDEGYFPEDRWNELLCAVLDPSDREKEIREAHTWSPAYGNPEAKIGTCRCGKLNLDVPRYVHSDHIDEMIGEIK